MEEDEPLNVEEATLDLANAAPGNKGRQRVTDQVRIRIVRVLNTSCKPKEIIWNLDASTDVQNSRLQYPGGEEEIFRVQSKIGE